MAKRCWLTHPSRRILAPLLLLVPAGMGACKYGSGPAGTGLRSASNDSDYSLPKVGALPPNVSFKGRIKLKVEKHLENRSSEFIGFKAFEFAFVDFQHVENRRGYGEGSCTFRFLIAPWSPVSGAGEFHELKLKAEDSCGPFFADGFALPGIDYAQLGREPGDESLYLEMNVESDAKGEKILFLNRLSFFPFGRTAQLVSDSVNLVVPMKLDQQLIEKEKWRIKEEFASIHRDAKGDKYMLA
jgi:hypothetical protein